MATTLSNGSPTITKFTKEDLKEVESFDRNAAMAAVGLYYSMQRLRIAAGHKVSAHERGADTVSEPIVLQALKSDLYLVEKKAARILADYARSKPLGQWCLSIPGVGPIITAGLLAHIDFHRCCCPQYKGIRQQDIPKHRKCPGLRYHGAILKFAGQLDPKDQPWKKGDKRPYNLALKVLCFKLGESFKKAPGHVKTDKVTGSKKVLREHTLYERLYLERKKVEVRNNDKGKYREQALERLANAKKKGFGISSLQRKTWESGRLQDVGLDRRAVRYAVKIFLSHFHQIGREIIFGDKVLPWSLVHGGHDDYIPPPNWPMGV